MIPDDQMTFDIPDDYHEPVTEESVRQLLSIIVLSKRQKDNYDMCCKFLEPLPWECEIIERVVRCY